MTEEERKKQEYDYLINGMPQEDNEWNGYTVIYFDEKKGEDK